MENHIKSKTRGDYPPRIRAFFLLLSFRWHNLEIQ